MAEGEINIDNIIQRLLEGNILLYLILKSLHFCDQRFKVSQTFKFENESMFLMKLYFSARQSSW